MGNLKKSRIVSVKNSPIFVVGCPRSGTFLLSTRIEEELDLAAPLETHFIPYFYRYRFLFGDLSRRTNRARLLDAIYTFLEIWNREMLETGAIDPENDFSLLSTRCSSDKILENSESYCTVIKNMFNEYSALQQRSGWLDKSAYFRHLDLNLLSKIFPEALFVHLIRDGRDVSLSWSKLWIAPSSISQAAALWREHVLEKMNWGSRNNQRYLEIKYEDLIAIPENVLKDISNFLAVEQQPVDQRRRARTVDVLRGLRSHQKLGDGIIRNNSGRYMTELTAKEIRKIEEVAGPALVKAGYLEQSKSSKILGLEVRYRLYLFSSHFSKNGISRLIKSNLPLFIWLSKILGVDVLAFYRWFARRRAK